MIALASMWALHIKKPTVFSCICFHFEYDVMDVIEKKNMRLVSHMRKHQRVSKGVNGVTVSHCQ